MRAYTIIEKCSGNRNRKAIKINKRKRNHTNVTESFCVEHLEAVASQSILDEANLNTL